MTQKDKIQALEQWIIDKHGYNTLADIYMQHKVDATNKILTISDPNEFERKRMERAVANKY